MSTTNVCPRVETSRTSGLFRAAAVALLVLAGAAMPAVAAPVLFTPNAIFQVQATNSPTTFTENVALTPGNVSLNGGALNLNIAMVNDGPNNVWLVFKYTTGTGGVLSQQNQNWAMYQTGLVAAVDVNFNAAYAEYLVNGVAQTPTGNIFGGYSIMANPVPGQTGFGLGASGFAGLFPAGPLVPLGAFIQPWSFLNATGIDSTQVNGYTQALRFAPQNPTAPEVPEPATFVLMGSGLLAAVLVRRRA